MRSTCLLLLLVALQISVVPSRAAAQSRDTTAKNTRIRRLEILADLWGKLWLFHPSIVTTDIDWDQVLVDAIPKVESTRSTDELVRVLNESLLDNLDDPLSIVFRSDTATPPTATPQLSAKRLSPDIGYVNVSNPDAYWERDFPKRFRDAVSELGDVGRLVIDMRFASDGLDVWTAKDLMPGLLDWFVDERVETGSRLLRVHRGWNQANHAIWGPVTVYDQTWDVEPGPILQPYRELCAQDSPWGGRYDQRSVCGAADPITASPVFVVNNTSMPVARQGLDALQSLGKAVVIWERSGSFPTQDQGVDDTTLTVSYPGGITAYLAIDPVMSQSGSLGARPDSYSDRPLYEEELIQLASELEPRGRRTTPANSSYSLAMRFPDIEPATTRPLSREERLLGLFKIWLVADRFFPHLEYADVDWGHFLDQAIPQVEAAKTSEEYYLTLNQLTAPLNDSHVYVWHTVYMRGRRTALLPIRLRLVDGKLVVAARSKGIGLEDKIRLGDVLLAVDGRSVEEIMNEWSPLISSSTPGAHRRDLARRVGWRNTDGPVELRVDGPEGIRTVEVPPRPQVPDWDTYVYSAANTKAPAYSLLPGDLGYINLNTVGGSEDAAMEAVASAKGLILDGRVGPGNRRILRFILGDLLESFRVDNGEVATVSGMGRHYSSPVGATPSWAAAAPPEDRQYRGPVVVLIDYEAQSAIESLLMMMGDSGRVTFVGGTTAGTTGNATQLYLPGGGFFQFTGMRVKHLNGDRFQNIGIVPDVEAHPTIEGIRAGRDEVLEKGIEVLRRKIQEAEAGHQ